MRTWSCAALVGVLLASATPALAGGKVGLGVGAGAAAVKDDLLALIAEQGEAVEIAKAPPKGAKRKAWAKDAQGSLGLTAVVAAEVTGKRLKLGLWVDGKPVSATGANLKGKGLDAGAKSALKSWLKAQLGGPGGARAAATAAAGAEEEEEEEAPAVAPPPPPAKGGKGAVAKAEPRGGPVVAPPPPPPTARRDDDEGSSAVGSGSRSAPRDDDDDAPAARPEPSASSAGDRNIAGGKSGKSGDFGGGFLGSSLGLAAGLPPLLVVHAEFHSVGRGFSYSDPITGNLRPYSVTFMPTPGVSVEAYPLTLVGNPALAGLGLSFGFRTSLGVKSARANSTLEFPTTYSALEVGAHYRISLGEGFGGPALIPAIGWSSTSFELSPVEGTREEQLPNVSYPGLKLGLGFDTPLFASVRLFGDGAFVIVGAPGEIISDTFFAIGSVNGLVARLGFSVGFMDHVAAEVGVAYQHFFYDFDPEVGDTFVAGGALDQYVVGKAGVRIDL